MQASAGSPEGHTEATLFCGSNGVGTLLLEVAMQWAMLRKASAVRLVCARTDWPMRHFAEKRGARFDLVFGQIVADIPLSANYR